MLLTRDVSDYASVQNDTCHKSRYRMTEHVWSQRLAEADTPGEILDLARQFLGTWSPKQLASLPVDCRPPILHEPENVGAYALALVRHQVLQEHDELATRMAEFFSTAQHHLSQLMSEARQHSVMSNPRYWRPTPSRHNESK